MPTLKQIQYDIDSADTGIILKNTSAKVSTMARHQGNHAGDTDAVHDALNKIDLNNSNAIFERLVKIKPFY